MLYVSFKNLYKSKTETLQNAYHTLKYFSYYTALRKNNIISCLCMSPVNLTSTWTISTVHIVYYFAIFCLDTVFCFNIIFSFVILNISLIFQNLILIFYNVSLFFNSLPNGEYSTLLIAVAFSDSHFSSKISSPDKNSHLLKFLDNKAEKLAVCLSQS